MIIIIYGVMDEWLWQVSVEQHCCLGVATERLFLHHLDQARSKIKKVIERAAAAMLQLRQLAGRDYFHKEILPA